MLAEPPIRLCCFQRHTGVVCPDGKVMCCLCFDRFEVAELFVEADGDTYDVCRPCGEVDAAAVVRKRERESRQS